MIDRRFWVGLRLAVGGNVMGTGVTGVADGDVSLGAVFVAVGFALILWGYNALDDFVDFGEVRAGGTD